MEVGFIKGTATAKRTRRTKVWQYRQIPAMYTPANIRQTTDMSLFYEKPPSEMSRYELQELEQYMRKMELGEDDELTEEEEVLDEEGVPIDKEVIFKQTDYFIEAKQEIRKLQPMRIGVFKKYWEKFKFNKSRRENMIELFDEADEQVKFYLEDEFRSWRDEIPGVREFIRNISTKSVESDVRTAKAGNTVVKEIAGAHEDDQLQEVLYSKHTFNPFN